MEKEVLVSVSGMQFDIDQTETMEVISPGKYFFKNEKHYIFYDEVTDPDLGSRGISSSCLKASSDCVELSKKGCAQVNMIFENGKKTMTSYQTPFGELAIGIHTSSILVEKQSAGLLIQVNYALDINYGHVSDCRIVIKVVPQSL